MKNNPILYSQLIEENMDLVPQMVNVLTRNYLNLSLEEYEELTQTSYLALCNAASKYDGHRPFRPYARAAVRNAIYGYWRTVYQYNKRFCSLDALLESEDGHSYEGEFHQNRTSLSTE
ncbi:MAG: sigma factor, partial [Bariatricus sp.]|nr:sigma factor [Bariatricus sp.]